MLDTWQDINSLSAYGVTTMRDRWLRERGGQVPPGFVVQQVQSLFGQLSTFAGLMETTRNYGLGSLRQKMTEMADDPTATNMKKSLTRSAKFRSLQALLAQGDMLHPKLVKLMSLLTEHFARAAMAEVS